MFGFAVYVLHNPGASACCVCSQGRSGLGAPSPSPYSEGNASKKPAYAVPTVVAPQQRLSRLQKENQLLDQQLRERCHERLCSTPKSHSLCVALSFSVCLPSSHTSKPARLPQLADMMKTRIAYLAQQEKEFEEAIAKARAQKDEALARRLEKQHAELLAVLQSQLMPGAMSSDSGGQGTTATSAR